MATFKDINEISWTPVEFEYATDERELSAQNEIITDGFYSSNMEKNIKDVRIIKDTILTLSSSKTLSSDISNMKDDKGIPWNSHYSTYSTCLEDNLNVEKTDYEYSGSQFLFFLPLNPDNLKHNILELKSTVIDYSYDKDPNRRLYNTLITGNNQYNFEGKIELTNKIKKEIIKILPDRELEFTTDIDTIETPLSSSSFIEDGAIGGSSPDNSDVFIQDNFGYICSTPPILGEGNGLYVYSWLKADEPECGEIQYQWMDRWIDSSWFGGEQQGGEYITKKSNSPSILVDVPSEIIISPNKNYKYVRYGKNMNKNNSDFVKSTSIFALSSDENGDIFDAAGNTNINNNGVIFTNNSFSFNGDSYLELTDNLILNDSTTISATIKKNNMCCGKTTQIIGNYYDGGIGLFFNTGETLDLLTFPTKTGFVYTVNSQFYKIFEKDTSVSTGKPVTIENIHTDNEGNRWIYDFANNRILKLDSTNTLIRTIILDINAYIISMTTDSSNNLYVLDSFNREIIGYNSEGEVLETLTDIDRRNNFIYFDLNDNLIYDNATKISVDSNNNIYKAVGSSIFKNDDRFYPSGNRIQDILIDKKNRIWIVDSTNIIKIVNSDGFLVKKITLTGKYKSEPNKRLFGGFKTINNCQQERIMLLNKCNKNILSFDYDGNIVENIDIVKILGEGGCLDNTDFVLNGDFTGYDSLRKINIFNGKYISADNIHLTAKARLKDSCGKDKNIILHYPICNLQSNKWHTFSLIIDTKNKVMKLVINQELVSKEEFDKVYKIKTNNTSIFVIGGNSGKVVSMNEERGLSDHYFEGEIMNSFIWNYAVDVWNLISIYRDIDFVFQPLLWEKDTRNKNFLEKVEQFNLINIPGHKSNKFNVVIRNTNITDVALREYIEKMVSDMLIDYSPAHTSINSVIWK